MITLPHLPIYKTSLWIETQDHLPVADFMEATFRGALGYHLKECHCPYELENSGQLFSADCKSCEYRTSCLYANMFDPAPGEGMEDSREDIPRPWSICAEIEDDGFIRIDLTFFGEHGDLIEPFVEALRELGVKGVGKHRTMFLLKAMSEPVMFFLDDYAVDGGCVYEQWPDRSTLYIDVESPMSLRKEGKVLMYWDTDAFARALLRRMYLLSRHQNVQIPDSWNYERLLSLFDGVEACAESHVKGRSRTSTRQNRKIDYSGFVGTIKLANVSPDALCLIRASTVLGVGKGVVFGAGRLKIRGFC